MNGSIAIIEAWLDGWTHEFAKAVEMVSGQSPDLTYSRSKHLAPDQTADLLWWKQTFEAAQPFDMWIGAPEATWHAIGALSGDAESDAAKAAYLEIIGQAQHGVASLLGTQTGHMLRCGEGQLNSAPDVYSLEYALVGLKLSTTEYPSIAIAMEPSATQILSPMSSQMNAPGQRAALPPAGNEEPMAPMLSRLMELELPLSVALGRSRLPIGDVLKVTAGSVIELDRNIGDPVELIVHGTVVARGEVVSVRGNYGVRIKELISRHDRLSLYTGK